MTLCYKKTGTVNGCPVKHPLPQPDCHDTQEKCFFFGNPIKPLRNTSLHSSDYTPIPRKSSKWHGISPEPLRNTLNWSDHGKLYPSGLYSKAAITPQRINSPRTSVKGMPTTLEYEPSTFSTRKAPLPWIPYAPALSSGSPVAA